MHGANSGQQRGVGVLERPLLVHKHVLVPEDVLQPDVQRRRVFDQILLEVLAEIVQRAHGGANGADDPVAVEDGVSLEDLGRVDAAAEGMLEITVDLLDETGKDPGAAGGVVKLEGDLNEAEGEVDAREGWSDELKARHDSFQLFRARIRFGHDRVVLASQLRAGR